MPPTDPTHVPITLRIAAIAASCLYLLVVITALRRNQLNVRQSVLWLVSAGVFLALSLFPDLVLDTALSIGFVAPSNAIFVAWLLAFTTLLFYQSVTTSRHADQLRALAQEVALLRTRLEERP